jgi:pyrroloquinoline quinone biosynthesis protein A
MFISTNARQYLILLTRRNTMWTKPEATEMRYGFEVTMYVMNR